MTDRHHKIAQDAAHIILRECSACDSTVNETLIVIEQAAAMAMTYVVLQAPLHNRAHFAEVALDAHIDQLRDHLTQAIVKIKF
jgi:hypothetical protein